MSIDQPEEFFGLNPASHRAKAMLWRELWSVAVGVIFLSGGLLFLREFSYGKDFRYYLSLAMLTTIGSACVLFGLSGAYRQWQRVAGLKAQPASDVLWYVLDGKGLHICNTMEHTPSGRALIPWTEMKSVNIINAAEPVAQLTYRGSAESPTIMDLMANYARRDGARFGDRLKARFNRKDNADVAKSNEQDVTISPDEIARIKILLAESKRPREPVLGPDGQPVCAPPPPTAPDNSPPRDDLPHPPLPWRTVP